MNTPTKWSENYFRLLLDYDYELVKSPAELAYIRQAATIADSGMQVFAASLAEGPLV